METKRIRQRVMTTVDKVTGKRVLSQTTRFISRDAFGRIYESVKSYVLASSATPEQVLQQIDRCQSKGVKMTKMYHGKQKIAVC